MGIFSFIKEAGENLFGQGQANAAQAAVNASATQENTEEMSKAAGDPIAHYIDTMNLPVKGLDVSFDVASGTVTGAGKAPDQQTKEKVLLRCGNVASVQSVNDKMTVAKTKPESQLYTVKSSDIFSKISEHFYGSANNHPQIFEANKPTLTHPEKIYPGQVLRIPANI